MFLPVARRNKEKETSNANQIIAYAVSTSAIWGNFMIYNPVKFILFNNPGGFHLACSDTVLGKEKNQTSSHYSLSCDFCHMPWNNNAHSSALRQQASNPISVHLPGGWVRSPQCEQPPKAKDHRVAASAPAGALARGAGKLKVSGGSVNL